MMFAKRFSVRFVTIIMGLFASTAISSMELEPRQWSHLPIDTNFGGLAYSYTDAYVGLDPVLNLADVSMELTTWGVKYIRTFELFDKTARLDFTQAYQEAEWNGKLNGSPATSKSSGLSDGFVRFAINLLGSPPLEGEDYRAYRASKRDNTVIGVGMVVRLPNGNYEESRLLNLGGNRFVFRPQVGISHLSGNWTTELTTEVALYGDNDNFFNGNTLEQDPFFIVHGHLIYTFRPGLWLSLSAGYDIGAESSINGVKKDDKKQNAGWRISAAYPISRNVGVNFFYTKTQSKEVTGTDIDNFVVNFSYMW
ncbi:MAG: transporter [Psychromonas sp.]